MALTPNMNVMLRAAEKAGRSLIRDFGEVEQLQVSRKGPGDFVSAADLRAEEIIYEELKKARPEFDFLMEERGEVKDNQSDTRWIVDPLDGTSNFLHGIPHWNISIALEEKGVLTAAIVFDPIKDETFRAERGTGAFIKNKRLRVSGRTSFDTAMIACGAPARAETDEQYIREYMAIKKTGANVRRLGAAALDLAYVAAGRVEGFWENNLGPWDVAAGMLLIQESGGLVSSINNNESPIHSGSVIAGNGNLFNDMKQLISNVSKNKNAA